MEELAECDKLEKNFKFAKLAEIIDQRIYSSYKLWKTNYMAHDLLTCTRTYSDRYTPAELERFTEYMHSGLRGLTGDPDELRSIFLKIYANPVENCGR